MTRDFVIDRRAAGELLSTLLERAVGDKLVSVPGLRAVIVKWSTPSALRTADVARVQRVIVKRSGRSAPRNSLTPFWAAPAAQTVTVVAEATWGETNGDLAADPASYQFPPRPAQGRHRSGVPGASLRTSTQHNVRVRTPHPVREPSLRSATPTVSPTQDA